MAQSSNATKGGQAVTWLQSARQPDSPNEVLSWARKVNDALNSLALPTTDLDDDDNDDVGVFSKDAAIRKLGQRFF